MLSVCVRVQETLRCITCRYEKHGFHGNTVDFYDDDNSFINQVIARKTGRQALLPRWYFGNDCEGMSVITSSLLLSYFSLCHIIDPHSKNDKSTQKCHFPLNLGEYVYSLCFISGAGGIHNV